ncbi:MAG: protein translocase subunit SecF [Cellulomonadaceae bacterium]|jgi:preprotein translocase subunit SecF|nr:protein translocase subunit SecF [Cellulomonadaceae bacterium]
MAGFSFAAWGNDLHSGRRSYPVVPLRQRWFIIAGVLALASIAIIGIRGLHLGIDFRGGTEITVENTTTTEQGPALDVLRNDAGDTEPRVAAVGSDAIRIQTGNLTDTQMADVTAGLAQAYGVSDDQISVSEIGPTWGQGVSTRAARGVAIFVVAAALFMAIYFRAWRMSVAAIVSMLADVLIAAGVYALIGWEVTPSTIIGFLTILGFSLYDKMVVFDKVRENADGLFEQNYATYAERANLAVNQTLVRSINTSVVALLPVGAILFVGALLLGAGTLRDLALSLFVGIAVSAISSLFLATPLEVYLREREPAIKAHTAKVLAAREAGDSHANNPADIGLVNAAAGSLNLAPGAHQGAAGQPKRRSKAKRRK